MNDELNEILNGLQHEDPRQRVIFLKILSEYPTGDERLLPYIKNLLYDCTPVLLDIPYVFGEVRWMAAHALSAEYKIQGVNEKILVMRVTIPITANELSTLAETKRIDHEGGIEGLLKVFSTLQMKGLLPFSDFDFNKSLTDDKDSN